MKGARLLTDQLTEAQRAKFREEYAQLPKTPSGKAARGMFPLLCRKWRIGKQTGYVVLAEAGKGEADAVSN